MATKFIFVHQTVSTEVTSIKNSVETDKMDHTNIENIWESGNRSVDRSGLHV